MNAEMTSEESRSFLRALPGYPFMPCRICTREGFSSVSCEHSGWERARAWHPSLIGAVSSDRRRPRRAHHPALTCGDENTTHTTEQQEDGRFVVKVSDDIAGWVSQDATGFWRAEDEHGTLMGRLHTREQAAGFLAAWFIADEEDAT